MNKKNIVTIAVFCVLIAGLTVASMVNPVKSYSSKEKRALAQMPKFSLEALFDGKFTMDYETFITDQFVWRDGWITVKNYAELALGKKDSGGVYFGKDGYLIEKHEYKPEQLESNIAYTKTFVNAVKNKYNTAVLIAPTASLIMDEKLPAFAVSWDQSGLLDRLSSIDGFVDCRDILSAHKDEYIYYRTDHHWTTLGAYYAYTELCGTLGIEPLPLESFRERPISDEFLGTLANKVNIKLEKDRVYALETDLAYTVKYNMDKSTLTDSIYADSHLATGNAYSVFLNENQSIVEINTENKNGKTLVMFKDSYSNCMISMLLNHYENIVLLDLRYLNGGALSSWLPTVERMMGYKITDAVLLYNAENFTEDTTLFWLAK